MEEIFSSKPDILCAKKIEFILSKSVKLALACTSSFITGAVLFIDIESAVGAIVSVTV